LEKIETIYDLILFFTMLTRAIKHVSFSHTLIMVLIIAFVTNYHFKNHFCGFFHG